jgi:magnesium chelatase family protein
MLSRINTCAFEGINVIDIDLQVHMSAGMPAFTIVGLPDKSISESRDRVKSALQFIGISLPAKRITINLSPANIQKEGSHYDLAIALGILATMDIIPIDSLNECYAMGELTLDARLRPVSGVLPTALHAANREASFICAYENVSEAKWVGKQLDLIAASTLSDLIEHFRTGGGIAKSYHDHDVEQSSIIMAKSAQALPDMADIKGQPLARRALEIAAAGGHNLLMIGPPGSGKSMLAERLPSILPPLDAEEALGISMIHSIAGTLPEHGLLTNRPFRDPHHSASLPALVGGGHRAKPGEISLAHNGVLFLDELPEFSRSALESLRQPLETGKTTIARANAHITYPAQFQLIAAMNPCKCGYFGVSDMECHRIPKCANDYQAKLSGPLLDRIDMHINMQALSPTELQDKARGEASENIRNRVIAARDIQRDRYKNDDITMNCRANGDILYQHTIIDDACKKLMEQATHKFRLSARGYNRILRVARTIADLKQKTNIDDRDVLEALSFRKIAVNN